MATVQRLLCTSPYGPLLLTASADGQYLAAVDMLRDEVEVADEQVRQTNTKTKKSAQVLVDFAAILRQPIAVEKQAQLLDRCDWQGVSPFRQQVLRALFNQVPAGSTVSYGQLAALAGRPKAARAVGSALRNNRFPVLIPCHRVLASNGLGGFMGNFPGADTIKRAMLATEGVRV